MTDTTTVRIGQVWADSNGDLALVVIAVKLQVNLRYVTGDVGRLVYSDPEVVARSWEFAYALPRLSCHDHNTALKAARHLTKNDVRNVLVDGPDVVAPLTRSRGLMFADDARANGWAGVDAIEQMVGDLR